MSAASQWPAPPPPPPPFPIEPIDIDQHPDGDVCPDGKVPSMWDLVCKLIRRLDERRKGARGECASSPTPKKLQIAQLLVELSDYHGVPVRPELRAAIKGLPPVPCR